jgi:hypothetical protein
MECTGDTACWAAARSTGARGWNEKDRAKQMQSIMKWEREAGFRVEKSCKWNEKLCVLPKNNYIMPLEDCITRGLGCYSGDD